MKIRDWYRDNEQEADLAIMFCMLLLMVLFVMGAMWLTGRYGEDLIKLIAYV